MPVQKMYPLLIRTSVGPVRSLEGMLLCSVEEEKGEERREVEG